MSNASNLAGFVTSIVPVNSLTVGVITASSFVGDLTGNATTSTTAGTATTATAASTSYGLTGSPNVTVGVITATSFSGDGSGLSGVGPSQQAVTSASPTTNIDLNSGNVIYFTHTTNTTVAFANTSTTQEVKFIRYADGQNTANTITWPTNIKWNGIADVLSGRGPQLNNSNRDGSAQTFTLITRDAGVTWYGWEEGSYPGNTSILFAWGSNTYGQLGQNNTTEYSSPVQIPGANWSSISSAYHSLAAKTNGTLWTWGINTYGELGQNSTTRYSSPVQIPGTSWSSVSVGKSNNNSFAIKTDGTLWAWGYNLWGQLGQNNRTSYSSPRQIPGTQWSIVSAMGIRTFAIKTDGTLWAWGLNDSEKLLGIENLSSFALSSPAQVPGTQWSIVSAGLPTMATKTDGTLWAWGNNQYGQLGQNNQTPTSSPVQIPGTTWSSISAGDPRSAATKTDGTLWSWGRNDNGPLGQNNVTNYSSPIQIPGTQWSSVSIDDNLYSTKTDGTLWGSGPNGSGQLGQNNRISYSSPVQIPGNTWVSTSTGSNIVVALG